MCRARTRRGSDQRQRTGDIVGLLEGNVVVISGAARGQGRAHAVRFAEEGADVVGLDICGDVPTAPYAGSTDEDLAGTAAQVRALGRRFLAKKVDVRDTVGVAAAVDGAMAELGRIDVVV